MSEINIDKLSVEIDANADKAASGIEKLIKSLRSLGTALPKINGLENVSAKLSDIAAHASSLAQAADGMAKMADSLRALSGVKLNVTTITNSLAKLKTSVAGMPDMSGLSKSITDFTAAVQPLSALPDIKIGTLVNNLTKLPSAINDLNATDTGAFKTNLKDFAKATQVLSDIEGKGLSSVVKSLKDIPSINQTFDAGAVADFAAHIRELTAALEPLLSAVNRNQAGLVALNSIIDANIRANGNMASANAAAEKSFTSFGISIRTFRQSISNIYSKVIMMYMGMRRLVSVLSDALKSSNEYIENLNLFTVTMGKGAEEAYEFAQRVNELMGIDLSDWMRNQGVFQQIVSGFGVINEKAQLMSKNLTQIGYDISSFYNIDIETAMQKVQSGIAGELEPLRRLGYALDAATLQQIAYNNGITQNINTMTQAQKSQLRYVAILQQSKNVMGDMARTIVTPANSMRILAQQLEQFKRAIGNIVSVIAVKLIPYLQAALKLLTEFANWLAQKMGFELPKIDYSNLGDGLAAVGDEADYATDALKDMERASNFLAGFDEMERVPSLKDAVSDAVSDLGNNYDLNIELPSYDFLDGLDKRSDAIYNNIKSKIDSLIGRFNLLKTSVSGVWDGIKTGDWYKVGESLEGVVQAFMGEDWVKTWEGFGDAAYDGFVDGNWQPMRDWLYEHLSGPESWLAENFPEWTSAWDGFGQAMYNGINEGDWSGVLDSLNDVTAATFGSKWTGFWNDVGGAMYDGIHDGNWVPMLEVWNRAVKFIFGSKWTSFWEGVGEHAYNALHDKDYEGIYKDFKTAMNKMFGFGSDWWTFWEDVGNHIADALDPFDKIDNENLNKIAAIAGGNLSGLVLKMRGYASGGYPTSGQLFMARENNIPEMVGRIGSQTAVANNDQITTAIANAVRQAMVEAMMVNSGGSGDTSEVRIYIDGKEVTDKVISRINNTTRRNGKSPLLT